MSDHKESISHSQFKRINAFVFVFLILIGGILFWVLPGEKISVEEKRVLSPFPSFTMEKVFNSQYTDSIDLYYSDHFLLRNQIISFADHLKKIRGYQSEEIQVFKSAATRQAAEKDKNNADSAAAKEETPVDMPYENFKSVIVANKRAVQMFSGSKYAAEAYGEFLKKVKGKFDDSIRIFCMAIPIGGDFYLPAKINRQKEKEFIDYLYSKMDPGITCVRAYEQVSSHRSEYIQFNTDHHWTGLGAYYAYRAFCSAAEFTPVELNQMTRKVIPNFLGTLYNYTRAEVLKENIDSVVYHKIPYETKATVFKNGITKGTSGLLYAEMAKGGNSYGVYLGSDYPLMRVITPITNKRKLVVFKDSYGNALSPYLASHFQEVFIVDYRYFNGNLPELIKTYGITDLLFAHNVYVLNSDYTIKREMGMLTGSPFMGKR